MSTSIPAKAFLFTLASALLHSGEPPAPAPNGISFPQGYETWRVIALSHRTDHHSLRAILGNDTAIRAAEAGKTNPWPDGTVLAKVVWKETESPEWPGAIVPGGFIHAEFMVKDSGKYPETKGWGYARWLGEEYRPYGEDAGFVQECTACHAPMKENDYVFTRPATFPKFTTGS